MTTPRGWTAALLIAAVCGVAACTEARAPGDVAGTSARPGQTPPPSSAQSADVKAAAAPATIADLFPPGAGREAVLNTCGSCHNLACSTIGQRTAARWDALKESHKEKVSDADVDATFAYLKANFNDSKPEPKVPPKFLAGGCTPF